MDELINTKLIWYDAEKKKPKIDEQVLIRIESYYENDFRGKGFSIGLRVRNPHGYESWYYLGRLKDEMGYVFKAICWAYLPGVIHVDNLNNNICNRYEILDLRGYK